MKFVMFADLHLERQFSWASVAAASRRRHGLRSTLAAIVELAVAERADAILCAGDLYESMYFSPDLAHFVADTFDCGVPVFISPGNHDHFGPDSLYHRAALPASVHVFDTPRLSAAELMPGVQIFGAAHVASKGTPGFFDQESTTLAPSTDVRLGLFHGSERGGFQFEDATKAPHGPFDAAQIPAYGLNYAFVGHHHRATIGDHHCYPGNPDPLEFGEDGQRGAAVATVSDAGAVDVTLQSVSHSEVHSIEVNVTGAQHGSEINDQVRERVASLTGFVRVDLVGELHPDVQIERHQLDDLGSELDGWLLRDSGVRRSYQIDDIVAEDSSVRASFIRLAQEDPDLSEADRRLVIELGLRAFDTRRDLEVV